MAEIGLVPIPESERSLPALRQHFLTLVKDATNTREKIHRFPGTMPLTLSRRHLLMVAKNDYVALEKSDGTRYMLLAIPDRVFLIDRSMRFYIVSPNPQIRGEGFREPQQNTVLDGELTFNIMTSQWEYLIYDCISIDGDLSVASRGFRERMLAAENYVAGPRLWAPFCAGLLRLRIKDYYETKDLRKLFSHIRKDPKGHYLYINNDRRDGVICNENDGVIFSPVGIGYQLRKCSALLKWKPPHLNSIDFTLQLERTVDPRRNNEPSVRPYIAYKGERGMIRLREVYFPSRLKRQWAAEYDRYNNAVVELAYDRGAGEWRYIRTREDKDGPNFASTVIDTIETIAESMEREELVHHFERNAAPPPRDQHDFVRGNVRNVECCTFRDDYFDHNNHDYLVTTPISMTPPPYMQPPPGRRYDRGGGRRQRESHGAQQQGAGSLANGRERHADGPAQQDDAERLPFSYTDDV